MLVRVYEAPEPPLALLDLGGDVLLTVCESAETVARVMIEIGDRPANPPYGAVHLQTEAGRGRSFIAFRAEGGCAATASVVIRDQLDRVILDLVPAQCAAAGVETLIAGLDAEGQGRLLRFIADFCRRQFRLGREAAFVAFCRRLLDAMRPAPAALQPVARLTDGLLLATGEARRSAGRLQIVTVDRREVRTAPQQPLWSEAQEGTSAGLPFAIILEGPAEDEPPTYAIFLASADPQPQIFACAGGAAAPRYIAQLASGTAAPATIRYVLHGLAARAPADPQAAALARAIQLARPADARAAGGAGQPVGAGLDLALGEQTDGLFLAGWLSDPQGLVESLEILSPFGARTLPPDALLRFRRDARVRESGKRRAPESEAAGFVAHLAGEADAAPVVQYGLRVNLQCGSSLEAIAPAGLRDAAAARDAVLARVPLRSLTPEILDRAIAPAVRPLHAAAMARQTAPRLVEIGAAPARPAVSVLIPLYRNLSFLRFQLAAFAVDREMRDAELLFVLDSPEQQEELEHLLRGLHLLYELPMRLVVMAANFGYAAANNSGARLCRGRMLALLNSDVIPAAPGWLGAMRAALDAGSSVGAVGPKLLFDDGSIQHAGMYFGRDARGVWLNQHYFKGYPRDFAPAGVARSVPAVTGAAMLVRRDLFERVGGFSEDYVIGDYEDSDLCLKLRQAGYDIRYLPAVEMFHYERQSIRLHGGYARSAASLYNQHLHAARWDALMAELMCPAGAPQRGSGRRTRARRTDARPDLAA